MHIAVCCHLHNRSYTFRSHVDIRLISPHACLETVTKTIPKRQCHNIGTIIIEGLKLFLGLLITSYQQARDVCDLDQMRTRNYCSRT